MSLLSNFAVFKTGTYTWTRPSTGALVNGRWVADGGDTVSTLDATVQPTSSKDLELLPEGQRVDGLRAMYTQTAIDVDDRITIGSDTWRVIAMEEHLPFAGDGGYYKGIISKETRA